MKFENINGGDGSGGSKILNHGEGSGGYCLSDKAYILQDVKTSQL
jgi:hypothetical protein